MLFVLLVVDDAVAAGLGHAVHLSDHHALPRQLGQHGTVKHGRGAAGVPDAVQAGAAAPLDVFVDGLHQHGSHSDGIAVHQAEVAVEVADVGGEVQRPALAGPDEEADERTQMEQGQDGEVAQDVVFVLGHMLVLIVQHGVAEFDLTLHSGKKVALREHDGLAAAGGAGSEHQHHQIIMAHAVGQLCRRAVLEGVHRAEFIAVGGLDVGAAAIVDAVVDDEGRLDKAQLIFQLGPGLFLVDGHDDGPGEDRAEAVDTVLIAVAAHDADTLALDVGDILLKVSNSPADVLHILGVGLFHHSLAIGGRIAERHPVGVLLRHDVRDELIYSIYHFVAPCCFLYYSETPAADIFCLRVIIPVSAEKCNHAAYPFHCFFLLVTSAAASPERCGAGAQR